MTNGIRTSIEIKSSAHKEYICGMKNVYYVPLENLKVKLSNLISDSKSYYHRKLAAKLFNPKTNTKTYWSIFKALAMVEKFQLYPVCCLRVNLLLILRPKLVISKDSLTNNVQQFQKVPSSVNLTTNENLTTMKFVEQLTQKLIESLSPSKAHNHDGISSQNLSL